MRVMFLVMFLVAIAAGCPKNAAEQAEPAASPPPSEAASPSADSVATKEQPPARSVPLVSVNIPLQPPVEARLVVTINADAILVEDNAVLPIENGQIDPSEWKERTTLPTLTRYLAVRAEVVEQAGPHGSSPGAAELREAMGSAREATLVVHPETPYELFFSVATALHDAKFVTAHVLANDRQGKPGTLPIDLRYSHDDKPPAALDMILTVLPQHVQLWSLSGLEGTLDRAKVSIDATGPPTEHDLDRLTKTLWEILQRRFRTKKRGPTDQEIAIQADAAVPFATVLPWMATAHMAPEGQPLFPYLRLAAGFR